MCIRKQGTTSRIGTTELKEQITSRPNKYPFSLRGLPCQCCIYGASPYPYSFGLCQRVSCRHSAVLMLYELQPVVWRKAEELKQKNWIVHVWRILYHWKNLAGSNAYEHKGMIWRHSQAKKQLSQPQSTLTAAVVRDQNRPFQWAE